MSINIPVSDDMVESIIELDLKRSIEVQQEEIKMIESLETLEPRHYEDLRDCRRTLEALREVLRYYTPQYRWSELGI